ncbi:salivary antigen-5-like isoform X2 [Onthophagus taurus]|uniref:salivary antigen-5-like isoform X2 n=1 Tax=Onthophagus taurus TaxID=166361 RepID=UPI000C20615E|nr:venom allergen 3-like [Onthophagus taurus]
MNKACRNYLIFLTLSVLFPPNLSQTSNHIEILECGISKEDSEAIVNGHNEYRKLIAKGKVLGQPRGINLKKMQWDQHLADEADKIAKLATFAHKKVFDERWLYVGQNLHMHSSSKNSTGTNWERCLASWFVEHKQYNYGPIILRDKTGHYTQMVWANTEYVGCGFCFFKNDSKTSMPFHKLYVCNYGPAGNFIGQVPYETGSEGCEELC